MKFLLVAGKGKLPRTIDIQTQLIERFDSINACRITYQMDSYDWGCIVTEGREPEDIILETILTKDNHTELQVRV